MTNQIYVSRSGSSEGPFSLEEIQYYLSDGQLTGSEFGWKEGCSEWIPLKQLLNNSLSELPPVKDLPEENEYPSETKVKEKAVKGFASGKQKAFLEYHGVKFSKNLTTVEASNLISKTIKVIPRSDWNRVNFILYPDFYENPYDRDRFKKKIKEAKEKLSKLKSLPVPSEDKIDELEEEILELNEKLQSIDQEIEDYADEWSCNIENSDVSDVYVLGGNVIIYNFLKTFRKPSNSQIKIIIIHFLENYKYPLGLISPEQFFFVYYKLYPDCLKKGMKASFEIADIVVTKKYIAPKEAAYSIIDSDNGDVNNIEKKSESSNEENKFKKFLILIWKIIKYTLFLIILTIVLVVALAKR